MSCQLNTRRATSKSHLNDDVWDEAGPDELDTEADVTLEVGQDFPDILMNEIDVDGDEPDQHFDGRAAEHFTVADKSEAMEVFKQFVLD